jgi:hypothetical protein
MFSEHLPLSPKEIDSLCDRLAKSREAPHLSSKWSPGSVQVPTFYGHRKNLGSNQEEFAPPLASVLIGEADGIRLILGTDNADDDEKPDIQIERRPHGWAMFLHPDSFNDVAYIYILDIGRTCLLPQSYVDQPIELVDDIPEELDAD